MGPCITLSSWGFKDKSSNIVFLLAFSSSQPPAAASAPLVEVEPQSLFLVSYGEKRGANKKRFKQTCIYRT